MNKNALKSEPPAHIEVQKRFNPVQSVNKTIQLFKEAHQLGLF